MRSGMDLTGFNERFNRLRLVATGGSAKSYRVSWGAETRTFTDAQLAAGINLPAEFPRTPFDEAFRAVDEAVARKQAYETRQIKTLFHGEEGHEDMAATVALTEKTRAPFVAAVTKAFNPVAHTIRIEPVL